VVQDNSVVLMSFRSPSPVFHYAMIGIVERYSTYAMQSSPGAATNR